MQPDYEYLRSMTETSDPKHILRQLMTDYGNDVWNFAYSLIRKAEVADDITQDVFLKVYRNLYTFRKESSVKTWLLTITRNTVYDYKRSAFLRKVTLVDWVESHGTEKSAEQEAMESMATSDIWQLVLSLPPKHREVLILYGHHQLSIKEISAILGVTEGTVKSRLHRARLKILELKERDGE